MSDHFVDFGVSTSADFSIQSLKEIEATSPQFPPPALVPNAMGPELGAGKWRKGIGSVSHEAADGMSIHAEEKGDEEVVGIPKGFKGLLSDLVVSCGIHEQHAQKHDVACDASRLSVVNLDCRHWSDLGSFHVEKIDVVSENVDSGENQHSISTLAVEPDCFVERKELELWSNEAHDISAHWEEDEQGVKGENETGAARHPY